MFRKILIISLSMVMLLIPASSVFANENGNTNSNGKSDKAAGNAGDDIPLDPGVVNGQDSTITERIQWVLPHGETFIIDGEEINIVVDWENLNIISEREPGNGGVIFVGIGDSSNMVDACGGGDGLESCNLYLIKNGGNGNGGGPLHTDTCNGVWLAPGKITATAKKISPNNVVIVGQDPDENGVTLEYNIAIQPTVVSYEKWELIGHRKVGCIEDNINEPKQKDPDDDCPKGWHQIVVHIWGCGFEEKVYKEGIDDLSAGASLTLNSRVWIFGELAAAYPGVRLINPDWRFGTNPICAWANNVCIWNFTIKIPVADPGWYDIKVEGQTEGTKFTPARSFEIVAGQFGAYLMDNTAMTR